MDPTVVWMSKCRFQEPRPPSRCASPNRAVQRLFVFEAGEIAKNVELSRMMQK